MSVFQKSEINEVEKKIGGEFVFSFKSKEGIVLELKKRANKINYFKCTCHKIKCEHLCAALFFLSDENLQLKKIKG